MIDCYGEHGLTYLCQGSFFVYVKEAAQAIFISLDQFKLTLYKFYCGASPFNKFQAQL